MTKDELKTGMVVETRNGARYVVIKDNVWGRDVCISSTKDFPSYLNLVNYDNELKRIDRNKNELFDELDIVRVIFKDFIGYYDESNYGRVIWRIPEPKKMTKSEIEEILGYSIEIVE